METVRRGIIPNRLEIVVADSDKIIVLFDVSKVVKRILVHNAVHTGIDNKRAVRKPQGRFKNKLVFVLKSFSHIF